MSFRFRGNRRLRNPPPPPRFVARIMRDPAPGAQYGPVLRNEVTATNLQNHLFYGLGAAKPNQKRDPLSFPASSIGIGVANRRATLLLYATGCCVSAGTMGGDMRLNTWMSFLAFVRDSHRTRMRGLAGYYACADGELSVGYIRIHNLVFSGQVGKIDPASFYFSDVVRNVYNPECFPAVERSTPGRPMHCMVHPSGATLQAGCKSYEEAVEGYQELQALAAQHFPVGPVSEDGGVRNMARIKAFAAGKQRRVDEVLARTHQPLPEGDPVDLASMKTGSRKGRGRGRGKGLIDEL